MSWHIERRAIFANSLVVDLLWRAPGGKARGLVDSGDVEVRLHTAAHVLSHIRQNLCIYGDGNR